MQIHRARSSLLFMFVLVGLPLACKNPPITIFTHRVDARRITADLRIHFNKATDASSRAVMADSDETSTAFAREAQQALDVVAADVAALAPHLKRMGHPEEVRLLEQFKQRLLKYQNVDRKILQMAGENTNLKAQRLSFGAASEAADSFKKNLEAVARNVSPNQRARVAALVSKAVLAVREIQVLYAPHIAEAQDAEMDRLEVIMTSLQESSYTAAKEVLSIVDVDLQPTAASAITTLDHFKALSSQIIAFSRRNTNVHSFALALREKPALAGACDESLSLLQAALAVETSPGSR